MYTVRRPLSHEACYVFDRKFQFLDGLPNSCSISLLAGRTCQKRFTKYYEFTTKVDAPQCMLFEISLSVLSRASIKLH